MTMKIKEKGIHTDPRTTFQLTPGDKNYVLRQALHPRTIYATNAEARRRGVTFSEEVRRRLALFVTNRPLVVLVPRLENVSLYVPPNLVIAIKEASKEIGVSVGELVRAILEMPVEDLGGEAPQPLHARAKPLKRRPDRGPRRPKEKTGPKLKLNGEIDKRSFNRVTRGPYTKQKPKGEIRNFGHYLVKNPEPSECQLAFETKEDILVPDGFDQYAVSNLGSDKGDFARTEVTPEVITDLGGQSIDSSDKELAEKVGEENSFPIYEENFPSESEKKCTCEITLDPCPIHDVEETSQDE